MSVNNGNETIVVDGTAAPSVPNPEALARVVTPEVVLTPEAPKTEDLAMPSIEIHIGERRQGRKAGNVPTGFTGTRVPWHRQIAGIIPEGTKPSDALKVAGMDWDVELAPSAHLFGGKLVGNQYVGGKVVVDPDDRKVVRSDNGKVLAANVSPRWTPFQNKDLASFLETLLEADQSLSTETAGFFGDGERVFITVALKGAIQACKEEAGLKKYLVLSCGHDGTTPLKVFPSTIRPECANMLQAAISKHGHEGITVRHSPGMRIKVEQAREDLGIIANEFTAFENVVKALVGIKMSDTEYDQFLIKLLGIKEGVEAMHYIGQEGSGAYMAAVKSGKALPPRTKGVVDSLQTLFREGAGLEYCRNTAWAALNAVTEHADWNRATRVVGNKNEDKLRAQSAMFGSGAALKVQALDLLREQYNLNG